MASGPHTFTILGVFSTEHFRGNRLPIVAVRGNALSQPRKAMIAKKFGFTATVFVHDAPGPGIPRRMEIFTGTGEEVVFSGHCVLGTAHYIFQCCETVAAADREKPLTTVLMTKAGAVPVLYNTQRQVAACSVPQTFYIHSAKMSFDKVLTTQPHLQTIPTVEQCKNKSFPVVSIVKGMTFSLVDLSQTPDVFAALEPSKSPEVELDKEQTPSFFGVLYYMRKDAMTQTGEPTIQSIQARVIANGFEDPGTGSACSALACYLAVNGNNTFMQSTATEKVSVSGPNEEQDEVKPSVQKTSTQRRIFAIQQGAEIDRACTIAVEVDVDINGDGTRKVKNVTISGRASFFAKGELMNF